MYRGRSQFGKEETEALAIYCSDHRLQAGMREFLDEALGLRANFDSLVVPGGPQCLVELDALPKFAWAARKWSRALIRLHSLKRLVLVAHRDCGWYRWLEEVRPAKGSLRQQQEEDLRAAKRTACRWSPGLAVELFYTGWDDAGSFVVDGVVP